MRDGSANIQASRIDNGHPGQHELTRNLTAIRSLDIRSCALSFTPRTSHGVPVATSGIDRHLVLDRHRDDICQVILALRIVITERLEPLLQEFRRVLRATTVLHSLICNAFLDGILLLNNLLDLLATIAHYASVPRRIIQDYGQQGRSDLGPQRVSSSASVAWAMRRHIAIEHQHPT